MRQKSKKKSSHRHSQSGIWRIINIAFLVLFALVSAFFVQQMFAHNFLAFRHVDVIITAILLAVFALATILVVIKKARLFTSLVLLLFTVFAAAGLYVVQSTVQVAEKLNQTASYSEIEMSIVVLEGSAIKDISELTQLQAPMNNDGSNINELLADLQTQKNISLTPEPVESYQKAYENLLSGASQGMVLNSAYSSLLEMTDADYASKLRTLYTYKITKKVESGEQSQNTGVMNIYVSGIDTYGSISTVSRSDVNIIMTINMNTHKILLTTTPRDAYVQIPDGGADQYDKLTHAGIYGVETSMKTLENLYGIDINYYARINFTSFLKLIDLLGGIEVNNDQAFSANGFDFPVGKISLNSEQALVFVRERHSLAAGDADRGRNQERVISAIINKLASFDSITNFSNIVNGLQNSVQTNMSLETMMSLANTQLNSGASFTVSAQDVTGTGSTGELVSYAMPTSALYMLSLDPASLEAAKQAIQNTMEGN